MTFNCWVFSVIVLASLSKAKQFFPKPAGWYYSHYGRSAICRSTTKRGEKIGEDINHLFLVCSIPQLWSSELCIFLAGEIFVFRLLWFYGWWLKSLTQVEINTWIHIISIGLSSNAASYGNQYIQTLRYKDIPWLSRFDNGRRNYILHRK